MNQFSFTFINGLTFMTATPASSGQMTPVQSESVQSESNFSDSEVVVRAPYSSVQDAVVVLIWFFLFLGGWILLRYGWYRWKSSMSTSQTFRDGMGWSDRSSGGSPCGGVPCTKCHYFKTNRHLSCAVHPTRVLKPEAHDCPDFWPRS